MSSYKPDAADHRLTRRALLRGAAIGLPLLGAAAACGFTPAYAPGGAGAALYGVTEIPDPNTLDSYILVQTLEGELGRLQGSPRYTLDLKLDVSEEGMAVTSDSVTSRFNVIGTLAYVLTDATTGDEIGRGSVNSFSGYSASGSTVATQAAKASAHERLMQILTDLLVPKLMRDVATYTPAPLTPPSAT